MPLLLSAKLSCLLFTHINSISCAIIESSSIPPEKDITPSASDYMRFDSRPNKNMSEDINYCRWQTVSGREDPSRNAIFKSIQRKLLKSYYWERQREGDDHLSPCKDIRWYISLVFVFESIRRMVNKHKWSNSNNNKNNNNHRKIYMCIHSKKWKGGYTFSNNINHRDKHVSAVRIIVSLSLSIQQTMIYLIFRQRDGMESYWENSLPAPQKRSRRL